MSIVFTISGSSGSGRSAVAHLACKMLDGLDLAIPYTTRPHRVEDQSNAFFYTSREAFEIMIEREELLEYGSAIGNYYGTPCHYLQQAREKGRDLVIQGVDDSGVARIKQKIPDAVSILILPGTSVWGARASESTIDTRLLSRLKEASLQSHMSHYGQYDHRWLSI